MYENILCKIFNVIGVRRQVIYVVWALFVFFSFLFFENKIFCSIYITVLLGTMKPYLNVGGPNDQVIRVADVITMPKGDMFMLRLEKEIKITRYVRPVLFRWKYVNNNDNNIRIFHKYMIT